MPAPLAGDVAVVTGARAGIGAAIARTLAEAGARVAVAHHDHAVAEEVAAALGPEHAGIALDVRSTASVDSAAAEVAERLGEATVLVNSAGINRILPAESFGDDDWEAVLDVNLTGVHRCCRAFGRRMLAAGRGSIVNVSSIIGTEVAMPGRAAYAATKAGIVGLSRVLGVEWAGRGVRVNAVIPGPVRTPMVAQAIADGVLVESEVVDRTPAGRLAEPEDVARAVLMLCGPGAGFVTAQTLSSTAAIRCTAPPIRRPGCRATGAAMPDLWGDSLSRAELAGRVGRTEQVAGIRLATLGDGVERGVRVLEFRTGSGFAFDVVVDRAFDVGRCEHAGRPLAWTSAVGFAGPWYGEPEGLGFLRTFGGGFLTTCGLDHALFMAEDTAAQYHYPPKQTETYGLHGRVSTRPARLSAYGERWDGDDCVLFAEAEVLQASVFGEQLLLRRRVEALVGGTSLRIHDEVVNVGHDLTPHMLLYHVNVGWPVVDEGSELLVPATAVEPRGDHPVEGYRQMRAPAAGFVEQVFEHELASEPDGRVPVGLVNRRLGLGAYQVFRLDQLPHHFVWRMLGQGTYVVGIEPCTNRTAGRLDARARGELIELEPGESRAYELELGALVASSAIDAFEDRVRAARS